MKLYLEPGEHPTDIDCTYPHIGACVEIDNCYYLEINIDIYSIDILHYTNIPYYISREFKLWKRY